MPQRKNDPSSVNTGGGVYTGGNAQVGGDLVGGNKNVVSTGSRAVAIGGNVTGSTIVTGNGNVVAAHKAASMEDFMTLLQELRQGVMDANLAPDKAQDIDADLQTAQRHANKPQPRGNLIVGSVKAVAETLSSLKEPVVVVEKLLPLATKLSEMAGRLFAV